MLKAEFQKMVNMVCTTDLKGESPLVRAHQVSLESLMLSRNICILCEINF